jgi:hypothetical protein
MEDNISERLLTTRYMLPDMDPELIDCSTGWQAIYPIQEIMIDRSLYTTHLLVMSVYYEILQIVRFWTDQFRTQVGIQNFIEIGFDY